MSSTRYLRVNKYTVVQLDIHKVTEDTSETDATAESTSSLSDSHIQVNKYTVVQLDIHKVTEDTSETDATAESTSSLSDSHIQEATELLKPVVTKRIKDVIELRSKLPSTAPAFITGESIRLGYKFNKRTVPLLILPQDDTTDDLQLFEERVIVYISLKSTGVNTLRKMLKTAADKKGKSGEISDYFKSQATKKGKSGDRAKTSKATDTESQCTDTESQTATDTEGGQTATESEAQVNTDVEMKDADEENKEPMNALKQIVQRRSELVKSKRKAAEQSKKTTTSKSKPSTSKRKTPISNTITSYCSQISSKSGEKSGNNCQQLEAESDVELPRSDEGIEVENENCSLMDYTRMLNVDDKMTRIIRDVTNELGHWSSSSGNTSGNTSDSDVVVTKVDPPTKRSIENVLGKKPKRRRTMRPETDMTNLLDADQQRLNELKSKELKDLTKEDLQWLVKLNKTYLFNIFSGRRHSDRHEAYNAKGNAARNLQCTAHWGQFTDDHVVHIVFAIMDIFCRKHDDYQEYIENVLQTEMIAKIYMDLRGLCHGEAMDTMRLDMEAG